MLPSVLRPLALLRSQRSKRGHQRDWSSSQTCFARQRSATGRAGVAEPSPAATHGYHPVALITCCSSHRAITHVAALAPPAADAAVPLREAQSARRGHHTDRRDGKRRRDKFLDYVNTIRDTPKSKLAASPGCGTRRCLGRRGDVAALDRVLRLAACLKMAPEAARRPQYTAAAGEHGRRLAARTGGAAAGAALR